MVLIWNELVSILQSLLYINESCIILVPAFGHLVLALD